MTTVLVIRHFLNVGCGLDHQGSQLTLRNAFDESLQHATREFLEACFCHLPLQVLLDWCGHTSLNDFLDNVVAKNVTHNYTQLGLNLSTKDIEVFLVNFWQFTLQISGSSLTQAGLNRFSLQVLKSQCLRLEKAI